MQVWDQKRSPWSGDSNSREIVYIAVGDRDHSLDGADLLDWVTTAGNYAETGNPHDPTKASPTATPVPVSYDGLVIDDISFRHEADLPDVYTVTAKYTRGGSGGGTSPKQWEETEFAVRYNFDANTTSEKILTAVSKPYQGWESGQYQYDTGLDIEVEFDENGKASVKGTNILVPQVSFTIDFNIPANKWTTARQTALTKMVGKMNSDSYAGFEAGELLLAGVSANVEAKSGTVTNQSIATVTYKILVRHNEDNFQYSYVDPSGSTITFGPTPVKGWDYVWYVMKSKLYPLTSDATKKVARKVPIGMIVQEVYEKAAFTNVLTNQSWWSTP